MKTLNSFRKSIMKGKSICLQMLLMDFLEIDFIKHDTYKKYSDLSVELSGMLYGYLSCPAGMVGNPYATIEHCQQQRRGFVQPHLLRADCG